MNRGITEQNLKIILWTTFDNILTAQPMIGISRIKQFAFGHTRKNIEGDSFNKWPEILKGLFFVFVFCICLFLEILPLGYKNIEALSVVMYLFLVQKP